MEKVWISREGFGKMKRKFEGRRRRENEMESCSRRIENGVGEIGVGELI